MSLRGGVDADALSAAIVDVVTRHESLRTLFPQVGDNATQKVLGLGEGIAGLESIDVERGSLERVIFEFSSAGFDLVRERPVRYLLITVADEKEGDDEEAVLVVVMHHMVADGWSLAPLAADLTGAYAARVGGNSPQWAPLPVQYADYTLWHREHLGDAASTDSLAHSQITFWKQQLAGAPEQLHLPTDRPRPLDPTMRGAASTSELALPHIRSSLYLLPITTPRLSSPCTRASPFFGPLQRHGRHRRRNTGGGTRGQVSRSARRHVRQHPCLADRRRP
ncbi:hypothetical protein GCM10020255_080740 [Rhodococcus baikonurensis]